MVFMIGPCQTVARGLIMASHQGKAAAAEDVGFVKHAMPATGGRNICLRVMTDDDVRSTLSSCISLTLIFILDDVLDIYDSHTRTTAHMELTTTGHVSHAFDYYTATIGPASPPCPTVPYCLLCINMQQATQERLGFLINALCQFLACAWG